MGEAGSYGKLHGIHRRVADGGEKETKAHPCKTCKFKNNVDKDHKSKSKTPWKSVRTMSQAMGPRQGSWKMRKTVIRVIAALLNIINSHGFCEL